MNDDFPYVEIKPVLKRVIGEKVPETRMYNAAGTQKDYVAWFDAITLHVGPCVSPGGAAARAHVTRAAVYKRMKEGRITAFLFHAPEDNKDLPKLLRIFRAPDIPYCYIPVSECQAWGDAMKERADLREEALRDGEDKKNWDDKFLEKSPSKGIGRG